MKEEKRNLTETQIRMLKKLINLLKGRVKCLLTKLIN